LMCVNWKNVVIQWSFWGALDQKGILYFRNAG